MVTARPKPRALIFSSKLGRLEMKSRKQKKEQNKSEKEGKTKGTKNKKAIKRNN
jgi:hypothetical protein